MFLIILFSCQGEVCPNINDEPQGCCAGVNPGCFDPLRAECCMNQICKFDAFVGEKCCQKGKRGKGGCYKPSIGEQCCDGYICTGENCCYF